MKKFLFILTAILALLLCTSVALAENHPCDACGSSNTSLAGSGAWCHWDCNECGYRTSRNHNPNSYNSGLVPDSCSGRCRWCGASAIYSSHTFTTWGPTGDATCTTDGTDTSYCDNVQCSATNKRSAPGSALGHDYKWGVYPPTCETEGYTTYVCARCSDRYYEDYKKPLGHAYDVWTYNGDGAHTAVCSRENCDNSFTAACSSITTVVGGKELTLCPSCGNVTSETGVDLENSANVTVKPLDGATLPGQLIVLVDAAPLEVETQVDAFYMFITSYHVNGEKVEYTGPVAITIDLNKHPYSMPDSIFFDMLPSELKARAFKIVRVEQEEVDGAMVEVWHEMPFTLQDGILTFETDKMGTFLMVLNIMEAPSVG